MGRILHLSDIHFGGENKAAVAGICDLTKTESFDLIAISGDITAIGARAEFAAAKEWVEALRGAVLVTPGNHDTPYANLAARVFAPWRRYEDAFGAAAYGGHDGEDLCVRAFNSARGLQPRLNWSKGSVSESRARRVATGLRGAPAKALKVAMCHHPLMEVTGGPMTGRVWGGPRTAELLARARADVILTGHVHTAFCHALPAGDGRTYAVGAATLSLRERGQPAGFNIVEWDDAELRVTARSWAGSSFETRRSWSVPRRT